jgi:hypothetical protein
MITKRRLDLQLFTEGGSAAGGGEGDGGSEAEVQVGDTLEDGTIVDANLASSMREEADMYPTRKRAAHAQGQQQNGESGQQASEGDEPTPEEWAAAKKRFARFYGDDVHNAVKDRFKNQSDATKQLESIRPMLTELMESTGAESLEELQSMVLDRRYEEEADAAGVPVEQYKRMKELEAEHEQRIEADRKQEQNQRLVQHIKGLHQQAEELQKLFPGFDLMKEIHENEEFRRMTAPGGFSVKQAYYATHGDELIPQLMAYGVQTGKDQISRNLQANQARPVEGASMRGSAGASVRLDADSMSDERYEEIKRRTLREGPQTL